MEIYCVLCETMQCRSRTLGYMKRGEFLERVEKINCLKTSVLNGVLWLFGKIIEEVFRLYTLTGCTCQNIFFT
jgi:hypothetical protein